jgi:hypothetical protein
MAEEATSVALLKEEVIVGDEMVRRLLCRVLVRRCPLVAVQMLAEDRRLRETELRREWKRGDRDGIIMRRTAGLEG